MAKYVSLDNLTRYDGKIKDYISSSISGFITKSVNDLTYYYTKSETYTQSEVNSLIGAISTINIVVVQTLPTQDISTSTIYLVPKSTSQTNNVYDEYIYVSNAWEKIGDTEIDLSDYVTDTELNTLIADYTTTADLTTLLAGKQNTIDSSHKLNADLIDDSASSKKLLTTSGYQTILGHKEFVENIVFDKGIDSVGGRLFDNRDEADSIVFALDGDGYNYPHWERRVDFNAGATTITPTNNTDVANKKYVDDNIPTNVSDLTNDAGYMTGMTVLTYGTSTWNDFITAYNANRVVYTRVSGRLAFMAYVNNGDNPTNVEFQYYRSASSPSYSAQPDEVFVYKLTNANGGTWTTTTRKASTSTSVVNNTGLDYTYSSSARQLSLSGLQRVTMPNASSNNVGKIYQFIGTTNSTYTNGYFYKCVNNSGTYSWQQLEVQPSSGSISDTVHLYYYGETLPTTTVTSGSFFDIVKEILNDYLQTGSECLLYTNDYGIFYLHDNEDYEISLRNETDVGSEIWITANKTNINHKRREYLMYIDDSTTPVTLSSIAVIDSNRDTITSVLATDVNYATPYTPQYDGSPATKKYVDDSIEDFVLGLISNSTTTPNSGTSSQPIILSTMSPGKYRVVGSRNIYVKLDTTSTTTTVQTIGSGYFILPRKIDTSKLSDGDVVAHFEAYGMSSGSLKTYEYDLLYKPNETSGVLFSSGVDSFTMVAGLVTAYDAQTISGSKTFSSIPSCSVTPTNNYHLVNKSYVDSIVGDIQSALEVLVDGSSS